MLPTKDPAFHVDVHATRTTTTTINQQQQVPPRGTTNNNTAAAAVANGQSNNNKTAGSQIPSPTSVATNQAFPAEDAKSKAPKITATTAKAPGGKKKVNKNIAASQLPPPTPHQESDGGKTAHDDDEANSTNAEASSIGTSSGVDPHLIRTFAPDAPLQFTVFNRIRKSPLGATAAASTAATASETPPPTEASAAPNSGEGGDGGGGGASSSSSSSTSIVLTAMQESNVMKQVEKMKKGEGGSSINDSHPFVSAFVDRHCPDLKPRHTATGPRDGTTFALLAVITGNVDLLKACLELGANPNDTRFLTDRDAPANYMRHGFTPFFIAAICEQISCMDLLFEYGASLHTFDRWGRTPLHATAILGNQAATDWLLSRGAPRTVMDRSAFRPGDNLGSLRLPPREPGVHHVFLRRDNQPLSDCACKSGRKVGSCGCVDDMNTRWYTQRASSCWVTKDIMDGISSAQMKFLKERHPTMI